MEKEMELQSFSKSKKKRRFVLDQDQRQELKEAFDLFDTEKTGKIDYNELKVTFKALGFDLSSQELKSLMEEYDTENEGRIDFQDFMDMMTRKYSERDPLDEIRLAFKLFVGDDSSGKITVRALRKISKELKENLGEEELQAMIDEFDFDQDGKIGEEEFIKIMTGDAYDF